MSTDRPLRGQVAVVTGATRGAGRGIAVELGAAGATVYCTGRSVRGQASPSNRPETIEETAEMVTAQGGAGIAVRTDHTVEDQVRALFARIQTEQDGRLDILVNDVWGGDELAEWDTPFWEQDVQKGFQMMERAVHSHILTSRWGVPLMVARNTGLIVEVGDGVGYDYRGTLFYSLAKVSVVHLAEAMAADLRGRGLDGVTALFVTPGFLRSEAMLDHFGITEENWRTVENADWIRMGGRGSETPRYIGRAVAALAADPCVAAKAGKALATWTLAPEYGFTDLDGTQPDWDGFFTANIAEKS